VPGLGRGEHVQAVGQHHDEDPGVARQARSRVEELACESEVHLCKIAWLRLDWNEVALRALMGGLLCAVMGAPGMRLRSWVSTPSVVR